MHPNLRPERLLWAGTVRFALRDQCTYAAYISADVTDGFARYIISADWLPPSPPPGVVDWTVIQESIDAAVARALAVAYVDSPVK